MSSFLFLIWFFSQPAFKKIHLLFISQRYGERGRESERDLLSTGKFPGIGPGCSQEPETSRGSPTWVAGSQTFGTSLAAFLRPVTKSGIRSGAAGTCSHTNTGCLCCSQWPYTPCHKCTLLIWFLWLASFVLNLLILLILILFMRVVFLVSPIMIILSTLFQHNLPQVKT